LLTAFFRPAPAENFTVFLAGILMALPVWGLRPVRAARLPALKAPKPTRVTLSPFFKDAVTVPRTRQPCRRPPLAHPETFLAMASINSALFMM